ncbi:MAG TPA: tRNA preQ1(34) S-adenosylmethionine ribosyltransferase-isomerase QueA [Acidimicrobiaceae bacterium]|nr:tRNA preQ1(34) S-adenosylmethionine ribosyltransferase-isomerase QueA [Acidimicrobiaceae bacterium]
METASFDYDLPDSAIAQAPVEPRDAARMLVDRGAGAAPEHRTVADLPGLLGPDDVVVVNTTRVLRARLHLRKATGGAVEVLLLEPLEGDRWEALVRPGRRVPPGTVLAPVADDGPPLQVEVGEILDEGRRVVSLVTDDVVAALDAHGAVPLPPYITEPLGDPDRYQTVYADRPGSVAAPTAGLHLTDRVLDGIRAAGAQVVGVDLWVGLGTFRPISAEQVEDHEMHTERYQVPEATWAACEQADRVVAIGTTTVRALESAAATGSLSGRTDLFLHPGSEVAVVDVLLTNYHLPRSSLLVLVEAFAGPHWRDLYATALAEGYRFLSFGDCMLLGRDGAGVEDRTDRGVTA